MSRLGSFTLCRIGGAAVLTGAGPAEFEGAVIHGGWTNRRKAAETSVSGKTLALALAPLEPCLAAELPQQWPSSPHPPHPPRGAGPENPIESDVLMDRSART